mgnify:CR=1 FL=1
MQVLIINKIYSSLKYKGCCILIYFFVFFGLYFFLKIQQIYLHFVSLDNSVLETFFTKYGIEYGERAEKYARKTFPKWKAGATNPSDQTVERLVQPE